MNLTVILSAVARQRAAQLEMAGDLRFELYVLRRKFGTVAYLVEALMEAIYEVV